MTTISSTLRINLVEDATKNGPRVAAALEKVQREAEALQAALARSGLSDRMQGELAKLGASAGHVDELGRAWQRYATERGVAGKVDADLTKAEIAGLKTWERQALASERVVMTAEVAIAKQRQKAEEAAEHEAIASVARQAAEQKRILEQAARDAVRTKREQAAEERRIAAEAERDAKRSVERAAAEQRRSNRETARDVERAAREAERERARLAHEQARTDNTVAGVAALYAAHSAGHAAIKVGERYREFDKERRYAQVVMGASDEQMRPLVDQAIRGSANSKFNDVEWLAAQRNLAARGYNRDQVLGFAPTASKLGQAFDVSMEDGVKLFEGAMLGFKKDVSTKDAAEASARRTADLEVKTSKVSGADAEDLIQLYKRGAAAARMAGLTEEQLLAFGGTAKKVNVGGDEAATAFVALTKNLLHPTHEARTAMTAAGIDFSKYQKVGPVNEDGFASEVARNYGVKLKGGVRAGLHRIFSDAELMKDPARFTPAVTRLLRRDLQGNDAKSLKSIAGLAGRYRDDSATGVDTQGLLGAIMAGMAKNPALANVIFGSKQGGRIASGLDPEMYGKLLDQLLHHADGFSDEVSDKRMAGFNGALNKLANQVAILETSIGRSFDNDGKGGFLTGATEAAGTFVKILGEANPRLLRAGSEAVLLAGAFAALKSVDFLKGGFGLKTSASALVTSAELLDQAAIKLGASKGPAPAAAAGGTPEGTPGQAPKPRGLLGEGGVRSVPKKIIAGGPAAIAEYLGYQAVTGGIDTILDALPGGNDRTAREKVSAAHDPLFHPVLTAQTLWAHLHGRASEEEIAARKAAEAPIAPPKVKASPDAGDETPDDGAPPIAGKRASGGPVSRGKTYLVGEHGPELFTPGMNGAISTADVQRLLSRASFTGRATMSDPEIAKAVRALSYTLADAVERVARAVSAAKVSDDPEGLPGSDRRADDDGGFRGGRRSFMERHGHFGGRRGFSERDAGGGGGPGDLSDKPVAPFKSGRLFAQKAPQVMARLQRDLGLDQTEAAAVLGNLGHESAGFQAFAEGRHGPGRGWAQWTDPGRKRRFFEYAQRNGLDPKSDEANYGYLRWELTHTHKGAIAALKAAHTPQEKLQAFERSFEGAGVKNYPSRTRYMNEALAAAHAHPETADADPTDAPVEEGRSAGRTPGTTAAADTRVVGGANLMSGGHYPGAKPGANLVTITTPDGRRVTVNHDAAPSFKRFIDQLEGTGYKVHSIGGYADRGNRSDPRHLSEHAFGNAIDINPDTNPFRSDRTDLPRDISRMAAENGLSWGGDWRHKDNMHFEWRGVRPWLKKGLAPAVGEAPTPEDLNRSNEDAYRSRENPFLRKKDDPLGLRRQRLDENERPGQVHAGLGALHGATIAPAVDNQHLEKTAALLDHIHGRIGAIGQLSARAARAGGGAGSTRVAGLGSRTRGNFSSGGLSIG